MMEKTDIKVPITKPIKNTLLDQNAKFTLSQALPAMNPASLQVTLPM